MIQIAVVAVSVGLIVLGIKGFTSSGIPLTKNVSLNGTRGKIVGTLCILAGLAVVPVFLLVFWITGN